MVNDTHTRRRRKGPTSERRGRDGRTGEGKTGKGGGGAGRKRGREGKEREGSMPGSFSQILVPGCNRC